LGVGQIEAMPDMYMAMSALSPQARAERFERCFEQHYADIARYCVRRAATPEDAEDAATDVFATAWRRLDDMPRGPDERLWLFGIARRVLANAHRAERRRVRLTLRLSADPPPAPIPPASAGSDAARIAQALATVSASDRELLLLAGWEGLTPAEIARVLDTPASRVSQRLSRARRRFAAALAVAGEGGDASARSVTVT
jgi:RNA polymerase sigma factor (sigma-70 family)